MLRSVAIRPVRGALCASVLGVLTLGVAAQKPIPTATPGPSVVGTGTAYKMRSDPRQAFQNDGVFYWAERIAQKGASFVKIHFAEMNLRTGDVLELRTPGGEVVERFTGRGPKDYSSFWALSAFGEEVVLDFRFAKPYAELPFRVDHVVFGEPGLLDEPSGGYESICSPGDFEDVMCYQADAGKWSNVLASVGVMSVGGDPVTALFCSGSNVSPQNYVLTNDHCVATQGECDSTEFVFRFFRTGCNDGSPTTVNWESFRCDTLVANSPLGACDAGLNDLDFSLFSVIGDPASTFGFATPDPSQLNSGEALYIVQHPAGRPHEITHGTGVNVEVDGTVLRYYDTLDTEGGSSGSPVYRESDDKLVGLHHCGGCSTPGTGNRGMLMSDIYPLIQNFLCSPGLDMSGSSSSEPTELLGNGNGIAEPGEIWEFVPSVRNNSCSIQALGVKADVELAASSITEVALLGAAASFGDVASGASAAATQPVRFVIGYDAPCGGTIVFDLKNLRADNGGPFSDASDFFTLSIGEEPFTSAYFTDFSFGAFGWTEIDGGTGTGPASTWTTGNPGARTLALTAPYFIADSDELGSGNTMDEELIGPVINASGFVSVSLEFSHDFNWFSGGLDEQADVDVRSTATGGAWVTVGNFSGADASGTVSIDITAQAAGQTDLQIRFHYYDAQFEFWWAVDDIRVLGSNGFVCDPPGNGARAPFQYPVGRIKR